MNPRTTKKLWPWPSKAGFSRSSPLLSLLILGVTGIGASTHAESSSLSVTGRVFCTTEVLRQITSPVIPTHHEHIWGFLARDGQCHLLLRTRYSEALFLDEQIRSKELVLKGRTGEGNAVLDVATIRSLKEGVVQDLYYYCNVCAIKSVAPEICSCCQGPVELIEKPLAAGDD